MLLLDHFVIHIDADMGRLEALQQHIAPLGYPFAPRRGKGTRGFKVANLWIGEQYYEAQSFTVENVELWTVGERTEMLSVSGP